MKEINTSQRNSLIAETPKGNLPEHEYCSVLRALEETQHMTREGLLPELQLRLKPYMSDDVPEYPTADETPVRQQTQIAASIQERLLMAQSINNQLRDIISRLI